MQVLVRGVHIPVSDALREYCEVHLGRALDRVLGREPAVQVEVHLVDTTGENKGGMDKEARVTVHVPGHPALHVTEKSRRDSPRHRRRLRSCGARGQEVPRPPPRLSGPSLADLPTE